MLLTAADKIPISPEWLYETKYDGFRCSLEWVEEPILMSRHGNILNSKFPEIISFCNDIRERIRPYLPLTLDGELVYLVNNFQSNFSIVQTRGRMRSQSTIKQHAKSFPCHYVVFDYLKEKGESIANLKYTKRKQKLNDLFKQLDFPLKLNYFDKYRLQIIEVFEDSQKLWNYIKDYNGEGIVAKREESQWKSDTRTSNWVKIKNFRYVTIILTKFNKKNGFFHGAVYKNDVLIDVVSFRHGLTEEEFSTLVALFHKNGKGIGKDILSIEPSICVEVACIDFAFEKLREPRFYNFSFNKEAEECTWQNMQRQLNPFPQLLEVTNLDKLVWPKINIHKDDYLLYLQYVAPYMLPFLQNRLLTVIRFPHGIPGEGFFQKNSPTSVPSFVTTKQIRGKNFIVCNNLESLLWLGNQLAIEFHIPFNTINTNLPTEIVFDLDPPSVNEFNLAIDAALKMKAIFDQFGLVSFVKTSGGKGMQIYIPISLDSFSYEDTGIFTKFICDFLVEQYSNLFTTERLKKNRNNRLYLDYVQHKERKTIIAPYSTRGNDKGLISSPLYWEEVNESLKPELFTIQNVIERIKVHGSPFSSFRNHLIENEKSLKAVLNQLKQ